MDEIDILAIALGAGFFLLTFIVTLILARWTSKDHKEITKAVAVIERFSDMQSKRMFALIEQQVKDNREMYRDALFQRAAANVGDSITNPAVRAALETTVETAVASLPDSTFAGGVIDGWLLKDDDGPAILKVEMDQSPEDK